MLEVVPPKFTSWKVARFLVRTVEHDTVPQSRNSTYAVALNQGTEYDCCGKDAVTTLQPESEVLYVHPPCACFAVAATADFPPWCPCVHGSMVCENTAAGKCAITLHGLRVKPQLLQLRTKLGAGVLEPTASQYAWEVAVCAHDEVQTIAEDGHLSCSPCPPGGSCDGTNMLCTRVHLLVPQATYSQTVYVWGLPQARIPQLLPHHRTGRACRANGSTSVPCPKPAWVVRGAAVPHPVPLVVVAPRRPTPQPPCVPQDTPVFCAPFARTATSCSSASAPAAQTRAPGPTSLSRRSWWAWWLWQRCRRVL